ncbi:MAG: shikimate kinase [archaeon]|jgi:shikimate kinase
MEKLFLIGYRGTGKTTLGKKVSNKLGYEFIDLDELIVKNAKKTIPEIFSTQGESAFREYETNALKQVLEKEKIIVACGGGIITKDENIELMKKNGVVCLLTASPHTIFKRIYTDRNRPALTNKNPLEEIIFMLEKRKSAYEKAKDFEVTTERGKKSEQLEKIITKYLEKITENPLK